MTLERFIRERDDDWQRLEALLKESRGRPERLGSERLMELGALYRSAVADLAYARANFGTDPIRRRLESLVQRGRGAVYSSHDRRASVLSFFTDRYWRRVAERPWPLAIAALLMFGPAVAAALWAAGDPAAGFAFVPEEFQGAADPPSDAGTTASEEAAFSAFLFTHNISVTFFAFAAGVTGGILTAFVLTNNGLLLGAIAGLAVDAGNGRAFLEFIIPHGPIELTCIVVTAAAGLRMGWALIDPGHAARSESFRAEALRAVEIVLGTMPWLVLAGLSEAFVRSAGLPLPILSLVGIGLFAAYWSLVIWRGRRPLPEELDEREAPAGGPLRVAPAP